MALTLSEILTAKDGRIEEVPVPEWGGSVFLRVMSGVERDDYDHYLRTRVDDKGRLKDVRGVRQKLLSLTLCDAEGTRMLQADKDAADLFSKKNSEVLCRLFSDAQRLNGLADEALEDTAKNSSGTGTEISG